METTMRDVETGKKISKKQADKKRREDKTKTGQNMLEKWKLLAFPIWAVLVYLFSPTASQ